VRRLVQPGAPADLGTWHATRQYHAAVDTDRLWTLFEPDLLPGYAWVFPLPDGRANVGLCIRRQPDHHGRELKARWADLMARPVMRDILGPASEPTESVRSWPIPCDYSRRRLATGRVLFVGDSAAVVDPMTGEGIAQALETGILAAEAIARGGGMHTIAERYRSTVDQAIGRDARFAARLSRVLATESGARWAIRLAGINAWTRRNFARWLFEDYPRALVLTPDRWRSVAARPGNPEPVPPYS
jgi:flavin-dependent dehydrogenase